MKSVFNEQFLPPALLSNVTVYSFNTHTETGDSEAKESIMSAKIGFNHGLIFHLTRKRYYAVDSNTQTLRQTLLMQAHGELKVPVGPA